MADLQPTPPTWYPKPDDIVTFADRDSMLSAIGMIMTVETVTTGKPLAWVDFFKLGAQQIPLEKLVVVTNAEIIEAYHRATEALKTLEGLLQNV